MLFNVNGTKNIVYFQFFNSLILQFFIYFVPLQRYGAKEDTKG